MSRIRAWHAGLLFSAIIGSQLEGADKPKPTAQQEKATADIREYLRRVTMKRAAECLAEIRTVDDWRRERPRLREQMLDMLGLAPLPTKSELNATVTGTVEKEDFVVENLHFQSLPGLYVTANFYRPKQVDKPLPTILYLCGHGPSKVDGVSFGNKVTYQHHGVWFAREGYCCLVIDTLQMGEIEGIHHGTHNKNRWWWVSRGYTSAGVEAWNSHRAVDYLATRPEVDMQRIGVTGRSGGGAYSWWLAAIDDRPACFVPVAGITDLQNHVVDNCVEGHCDCMYMVNTYGWDFAAVAALCAPRPLLISNSDKDRIFPLDGVVRTHAKVRHIYELEKAADKLGLLITEGPHKDTQELQVPAFRWMNRWLKQSDAQITRAVEKPLQPKELKVFTDLPADERNTKIDESFVAKANLQTPSTFKDWEEQRVRLIEAVRTKSLRNWPRKAETDNKTLADETHDGVRLRVIEYLSDENLRFSLFLVQDTRHKACSTLEIQVADDEAWQQFRGKFDGRYRELVDDGSPVSFDSAAAAAFRTELQNEPRAIAVVCPRGMGVNRWAPDERMLTHLKRRFVLLGETVDQGRIWDIRRAIANLMALGEFADAHFHLSGRGPAAGLAVYAGFLDNRIERLTLIEPPATHQDGPVLLNVLRVLDMPQAAALLFSRRVTLVDVDPSQWSYTKAVADLYPSDKPLLEFRGAKRVASQ